MPFISFYFNIESILLLGFIFWSIFWVYYQKTSDTLFKVPLNTIDWVASRLALSVGVYGIVSFLGFMLQALFTNGMAYYEYVDRMAAKPGPLVLAFMLQVTVLVGGVQLLWRKSIRQHREYRIVLVALMLIVMNVEYIIGLLALLMPGAAELAYYTPRFSFISLAVLSVAAAIVFAFFLLIGTVIKINLTPKPSI